MRNKVLILSCVSILAFGFTADRSYAGWSKSSSTTTSRSYSYSKPSRSGWSVTSPKNTGISGFGSKPSGYNSPTPKSLSSNSTQSVLEKKQNSILSNNSLNNVKQNNNSTNYNSYSGSSSSIPKNVVNNNTTIIKKKYYYGSSHTPVYYSVPTYYTPHHDHYGLFSGMFLGMMLSHAMEPSYYNWAYSHYNDPGYIAWHQDMVMQAANNQQLRDQLNQLDAKVDQLKSQNSPTTNNLPDGISNDQVNYHQDEVEDKQSPTNTNSSGSFFLKVTAIVLSVLVVVAVVLAVLL